MAARLQGTSVHGACQEPHPKPSLPQPREVPSNRVNLVHPQPLGSCPWEWQSWLLHCQPQAANMREPCATVRGNSIDPCTHTQHTGMYRHATETRVSRYTGVHTCTDTRMGVHTAAYERAFSF